MRKLVFSLIVLSAAAASAEYAPEKWNLKAREDFAAQRFGIFVHWGLYSCYAQGEWYLQCGNKDNDSKSLDREAYERMAYGFCPSKFDAREWVRIIKDSGAKYLTITSRHHDGFSLWPTKVDDGYNITRTPFANYGGRPRDILGELAAACKEAGIQLNFYYSLMDWHRGDYPPGNVAKKVLGAQKGDYRSYKKFMMGQIAELIDSYRPGNIWFDGEWEHMKKENNVDVPTLDWEFDDIYDLIHSKRTLVANNNHQPIRPKEDLQLFERDLPGENDTGFSKGQTVAQDRPIEQCDVIQNGIWGYKIGENRVRTAGDICTLIVKNAAKNSNLLMNVGPDGSGQFPAKAVAALAEVGKWMRANGHAIYSTKPGPIQTKEIVSTQKGDQVYLFRLTKDYPQLITDQAEVRKLLAK